MQIYNSLKRQMGLKDKSFLTILTHTEKRQKGLKKTKNTSKHLSSAILNMRGLFDNKSAVDVSDCG